MQHASNIMFLMARWAIILKPGPDSESGGRGRMRKGGRERERERERERQDDRTDMAMAMAPPAAWCAPLFCHSMCLLTDALFRVLLTHADALFRVLLAHCTSAKTLAVQSIARHKPQIIELPYL